MNGFNISYANEMKKYHFGKLTSYFEVFKDIINIQDSGKINFEGFCDWLYKSLAIPDITICSNFKEVDSFFSKNYKQPTLGIIK